MNPDCSESINPLLDIDGWLDFCQTKGGGLMEDHMDTELMNIINNSYHRGEMSPSRPGSSMAMTVNMNQHHTSYDLTSLLNSADATSVTTMALPRSFINIPTNSSSTMSSNITSGTATASTGLTGNGAVKVKKKRVRASRRVPTTVLRTDTSNFKAMVQHFTGVPQVDTSSSSSSPTTTTSSTPTTNPNPTSSQPPFTKPLPHPAVCKIPPNSTHNKPSNTTSASNDGEQQHSLSLPSSFSSQSIHDISSPLLSPNVFTSDPPNNISSPLLSPNVFTSDPPNNNIPEEHTMSMSMSMSAMDAAFFEKLWS